MPFFGSKLNLFSSIHTRDPGSSVPPPLQWTPAPEQMHEFGKWNDTPQDEYDTAEDFCLRCPLDPPKLLSTHIVDSINQAGCSVYTTAYGFHPHSLVNFGGETFRWLEGNEWGWRVEGHVRRLGASGRSGEDEMLPAYQLQAG